MGRPSKLQQTIRLRDDGSPVTAGQHLIERVELGLALNIASSEAGISRETFRAWRLRGARARADEAQGFPVDPKDIPYIDWLDRLEAAETAAELRYLTVIDHVASEQQQLRKVVVKKAMQDIVGENGQVTRALVEVERTETIEMRPPDWQAAKWRLETMRPGEYTRRVEVAEATSTGSMEERAAALSDEIRAYLTGRDEVLEGPVRLDDDGE